MAGGAAKLKLSKSAPGLTPLFKFLRNKSHVDQFMLLKTKCPVITTNHAWLIMPISILENSIFTQVLIIAGHHMTFGLQVPLSNWDIVIIHKQLLQRITLFFMTSSQVKSQVEPIAVHSVWQFLPIFFY